MVGAEWEIFGIVVSRLPENAFLSIPFLIMPDSCFVPILEILWHDIKSRNFIDQICSQCFTS